MEEQRIYELDLEKIKKDFKFNNDNLSLTHSQCKEFKLLPYAANEKTLVSNFDGVIGAFSRNLCDKQIENNFKSEMFINNVVESIADFDGNASEEAFRNIIETMFLEKDNLVDFNIKTLNYRISTSADEKIAKFLNSIFIDEDLKELVKGHYDKDVSNILYKIVLKALPELKEKVHDGEEYKSYLPFVKELFKEDLIFLLSNEELYKNSIKRFIEYYNMFYISQLAIKLSKFNGADLTKADSVYYTLSFESTSKNRTAYQFGWEILKGYVDDLFSHAITLEFLNHSNIDEQLGYVELFNIFNNENQEKIESQLEELCESYIARRQDGIDWDGFEIKRGNSENKAFDKVYKLFEAVRYQFQGKTSTRTRANDAYNNWFKKFVEANFGKRRGSLGYCLNLNEEDIILLTKICIKKQGRLKLSVLFNEFEKRGISFDRDSRIKIIGLYEKLNLLEKKSDSGDAQYVRSVL